MSSSPRHQGIHNSLIHINAGSLLGPVKGCGPAVSWQDLPQSITQALLNRPSDFLLPSLALAEEGYRSSETCNSLGSLFSQSTVYSLGCLRGPVLNGVAVEPVYENAGSRVSRDLVIRAISRMAACIPLH